jgi:hypothetical protein
MLHNFCACNKRPPYNPVHAGRQNGPETNKLNISKIMLISNKSIALLRHTKTPVQAGLHNICNCIYTLQLITANYLIQMTSARDVIDTYRSCQQGSHTAERKEANANADKEQKEKNAPDCAGSGMSMTR